MQIVVLTREERFRALLQRLAGSRHALTYVSEFPEAQAAVARTGAGVAVADTACLGPDPVTALESLRQASPHLVTVAYGERDEGARLMELVSRGVLFRFIVRPATPGQSRLYIEAAAKRAEEGLAPAPEPWKKAQPPAPPVADHLRAPVIPAGITVVALAATAILLSRGPGPRPPAEMSDDVSQAGRTEYRTPAGIAPRGDAASGRIGLMAAGGGDPGASAALDSAPSPAYATIGTAAASSEAGDAQPPAGRGTDPETPAAGRQESVVGSPAEAMRREATLPMTPAPEAGSAAADAGRPAPDAGPPSEGAEGPAPGAASASFRSGGPGPDAGSATPVAAMTDREYESVSLDEGRQRPHAESPSSEAHGPAPSVGSAFRGAGSATPEVEPVVPDAGRPVTMGGGPAGHAEEPVSPVAGDVGVVDAAELLALEAGPAEPVGDRLHHADSAPGPERVAAAAHGPKPETLPTPAEKGMAALDPAEANDAAPGSDGVPTAGSAPAAGRDPAETGTDNGVGGESPEPREVLVQPSGETTERPPSPWAGAAAETGESALPRVGRADPEAPAADPTGPDGRTLRPEPHAGPDPRLPAPARGPEGGATLPESSAETNQGSPAPMRVAALDAARASAPSNPTRPSTAAAPAASRAERDPEASGPRGGQAELPATEVEAGGEPLRVRYVAPDYPRKAWLNRQEGKVKLRFLVGESGAPEEVAVVSASPRRVFDRAAIEAVQQWRYQPPSPGAAGRAQVEIEIEFRMD